MNMIIYELQQKISDKWHHKGFFMSYELAQKAFIYKDGLFRIVERTVYT